MSWDDGIDYLKQYRTAREEGLSNKAPLRWFTADVDKLCDLIDDVFEREDENSEWEKLYDAKGDVIKTSALRTKISFLAGQARDLRTLYMADGPIERPRVGVDHDRYEYMQCGFHLVKIEQLRNIMKYKE